MLNKKIIIIFIFFFVSLLTTSTVFSNENTIIDENSELLFDYQLNYDVTIIESSNEHAMNSNIKGFSELNKLINDNDEIYIELPEDYTYNPSYDFNFKNGISINRQINIIGNGFTINGGNTARIFNITVNNVFISGVNFINAYSSDNGGAIIGSTNFGVINCNFTNNVANDDGGAIYGGTATNCNFENNIAKRGGSISKGYAISSYFIRNSANYGSII